MSSPFATKEMAEGYAKARPPLHAHILGRAAELLELRSRIPSALDIGCGSGVSTRPLTGLAAEVIGSEPSDMMTARAREAECHPPGSLPGRQKRFPCGRGALT